MEGEKLRLVRGRPRQNVMRSLSQLMHVDGDIEIMESTEDRKEWKPINTNI